MVRRDHERSREMSKGKRLATAKPRSGAKSRSRVKRAKPVVHHKTRRSKQAAVLAMLSRPSGTTITAIMAATGWQARSAYEPAAKYLAGTQWSWAVARVAAYQHFVP
jgi:hypothetical protein